MAELNDLGVVLLKAVVVDDLKKQLVGDSNPIPYRIDPAKDADGLHAFKRA